jgi:hypothetical protein
VDEFSETVNDTLGCPTIYTESAFVRSCEEFVEFFSKRRNQTLKSIPAAPKQQRKFKEYPYRTTTFRAGANLIGALVEIETGYDSPDKRWAVDNCRLACLIHLNLIMADHGDFSSATEEYLLSLHHVLEDDDDDSSLSAEHLLWTLLTAFQPQGHYERVWKMSRLMGVVKETSSHMRSIIEEALRTFLRLPESVEDLELATRGWSRDEFLREAVHSTNEADRPSASLQPDTSCLAGMNETLCSQHCRICPLKPPTY